MLKFLVRKITGKEKPQKPKRAETLAKNFRQKSSDFIDFTSNKLDELIDEFGVIKEKSKDLEKTNFNLGRIHLQKGDVKEASFRFWLMTKFYPKNLDAKYELAYCLALREKYKKSQKILELILNKEPNYSQKAVGLLDHVKKMQELKK